MSKLDIIKLAYSEYATRWYAGVYEVLEMEQADQTFKYAISWKDCRYNTVDKVFMRLGTPSSRTDQVFIDFNFDSLEEAMEAALKLKTPIVKPLNYDLYYV